MICMCGTCNVCKTRERMRKARQAKAVNEAKSEHVIATTPNKELPVQESSSSRRADNLAIWVDGNSGGYDSDSLRGMIYLKESDLDSEIRSLQDQVHSFSKKPRRRGKMYWYQWVNRTWKYVGAVDAKHDPRTGLRSRIEALRQDKRVSKELMKHCVIKELGDHLLIDIEKFRAHVDKRLPGNIIQLKDVIS